MCKHKQIILFEAGEISLEYITEQLPLRKTFFCFTQFCVLSNVFHFRGCSSFHLPEYFFYFQLPYIEVIS